MSYRGQGTSKCAIRSARETRCGLWSGADSRDEVHYLSGWVYERRFRRWLEGTGYDLEILRHADDALASVSWRISPIDEQICKLRITIYPYALQKYPVVVRMATSLISRATHAQHLSEGL